MWGHVGSCAWKATKIRRFGFEMLRSGRPGMNCEVTLDMRCDRMQRAVSSLLPYSRTMPLFPTYTSSWRRRMLVNEPGRKLSVAKDCAGRCPASAGLATRP